MIFLLGLVGCMNSNFYEVDKVKIVSVTAEGETIKVIYHPPAESLYHSPGIQIVKHGNETIVQVVRCHIEKKCKTDIDAKLNESNQYSVSIPNALRSDQVYLKDGSGKKIELNAR